MIRSARLGLLRAIALAALGLGAIFPHAGAQPADALVRPGIWQITPDAVGGATVGYQLCFKTGSLDDLKLLLPNLPAPPECRAVTSNAEPGLLLWQIDCPARAFKATARYTFNAESIDGRLLMERGVPVKSSTQTIRARYSGACQP